MAANLSVDLTLDPDFIRKLVTMAKAAEFEMGAPEDDDPGDDAEPDDPTVSAAPLSGRLEEETEPDHTGDEVRELIEDLNEDEAAELVALTWIGRGDFDASEFDAAVAQAKSSRDTPTGDYLLSMPLFPSYLEAGLDSIEID